ncbi:MAG: HAD family hydrolase [Acholeplasmatales bacterium]|nr:HAD family hydrolase [Acholeplasmatales bacterium]
MKALFLDRDGVINIDKNYVYKIEDFEFIDDIFKVCKYYQDKGYLIIVVTNQTGIGLNLYTLDDFLTVNDFMIKGFKDHGVVVDDVFYCPHNPNLNCECRKPKPKLFFIAKAKYNIDLNESIMIGDKITDAQAAHNAGIKEIYLINNDQEFDFDCNRIKSLLEVIK